MRPPPPWYEGQEYGSGSTRYRYSVAAQGWRISTTGNQSPVDATTLSVIEDLIDTAVENVAATAGVGNPTWQTKEW